MLKIKLDSPEVLVLDEDVLVKVLAGPTPFRGFTFICMASNFLQRPPYFNRYSSALMRLLSIRRHYDWSFIFITTKDADIKDKGVLQFFDGREMKLKSRHYKSEPIKV